VIGQISLLVYFISGTSISLNSLQTEGPPTVPEFISSGSVENYPPAPSVCPYTSNIGQQNAIFKKLITSLFKGADAVTTNSTRPPKAYFVLLKTKAS
jgi:hypothetical protein